MFRNSASLSIGFLLILATVVPAAAAAQPEIVAYVFQKDAVLQPGSINARQLTRINFAFANIQNGKMVTGYSADEKNLAFLSALKQENPRLTVLVSVGGWLWSGNFSDMALTAKSRKIFIQSAVEFLKRYNLDGLDVDWEYPGLIGAGNRFRAEDKHNFTLLLKELRERFDKEKNKMHHPLYLTIAAGATTDFLEHTEMGEVQKYVDTVNLMTYDFYEPGSDPITGHHAPLLTNPLDPKRISADRSVREFEEAGVPAAKILLGVPFYGHAWGQVADREHGLFQPGKAVPNTFANYNAIVGTMLNQGYTRYWDPVASAPYLYNAEKQIWVSYDDPESLQLKCRFIRDRKLGGVMFWSYSSDDSGALLGTLHSCLLGVHTAEEAAR